MTIEIYGDAATADIRATVERLTRYGYDVHVSPRPDHDTGLGPCGKYSCNCPVSCESLPQFKPGHKVWVRLQLPGNTEPSCYPAKILALVSGFWYEDRPRYDIEIMDGRIFRAVDSLLVKRSIHDF